MERRSFLSLLVTAPLLAKAGPLIETPPPVVGPRAAALIAQRMGAEAAAEAASLVRYMLMPLPFAPDNGFDSLVGAGRVARFVARPQIPLRVERLLVNGGGFDLLGVSSAGDPQFDDAVPADAFGQNTFGSRIVFDPTPVGGEIVLCVHNRNPEPRTFVATMICRGEVTLTPEQLERERLALLEPDDDEDSFAHDFDDDDDDFDDLEETN